MFFPLYFSVIWKTPPYNFSHILLTLFLFCMMFPNECSEDPIEAPGSVKVNPTVGFQSDDAMDSRARRSLSQMKWVGLGGTVWGANHDREGEGGSSFLPCAVRAWKVGPEGVWPLTLTEQVSGGMVHPLAKWGTADSMSSSSACVS